MMNWSFILESANGKLSSVIVVVSQLARCSPSSLKYLFYQGNSDAEYLMLWLAVSVYYKGDGLNDQIPELSIMGTLR